MKHTLELKEAPRVYSPNTRTNKSSALTQAIEMQRNLAQMAGDLDEKPSIRALAARSWCMVTEEIRKLKMKPLPKSIDVTKVARPRRSHAKAWTEEAPKESLPTADPSPPHATGEG